MRHPPAILQARLLDSLKDLFILVLDQEQRVVYANAAFLEHFGLTGKEVSGRLCFDLVRPFAGAGIGASPVGFCGVPPGPYFPERTILSREFQGKKFVYESTLYHLHDDQEHPWTACVFRDITDKFHLEAELRQLYELERNLVQASMDGIIANDPAGNILIFNEGAARITGYRPEEVIGRINVADLYPPRLAHEIKHKVYDHDYGGSGILENFETVVRHKNGALIPIWLSARLLMEDGQEVGIVGYFRDLRERKRLEQDLLRNERLVALGKMVAHVTHEIKNPLMVMGGFARQLERRQDLPGEAGRKLQFIREEVDRLEKFLSEMGSFTRIAPTQKRPGNLLRLLREVGEMMADGFAEKGVTFHIQAPPELPSLPFDAGQLRQVLINIFKNALEAMPQGGRLTVALEVQDEQILLRVTDTGQGMPPEQLKALFTPFVTTKEGGTGLGLTICRQLIEQHQGEIHLTSEVNQGTTCHIRLPRR